MYLTLLAIVMQRKVLLNIPFWLQPFENVVGMKRKGTYYTQHMVPVGRLVATYQVSHRTQLFKRYSSIQSCDF